MTLCCTVQSVSGLDEPVHSVQQSAWGTKVGESLDTKAFVGGRGRFESERRSE